MAAATDPVSHTRLQTETVKSFGGFVATGQTFEKGWYLARNASGLFAVATVATSLMPGGFVDRTLEDVAAGDDTDLVNVDVGIFSVPMLSTSTFGATDKPGPIYAHNNYEFAKSASGRSIAGLFLCLDDSDSTRCWAWIGPEGAAIAKAMADAAVLAHGSTIMVDEWTNALAAAAAGLKAATATVAAPVTLTAADLISGGKTELAARPRNVTFTTAGGTAADAPANAVITGTDIDDAALTETVTLAQTATIASGVKAFKTITSIAYPPADGTGATVAVGYGAVFGLSKTIKSRAGRLAAIQEVAAGSVVTNGTLVDSTTSPPHGTYSPNTAPDGANDYALTYEQNLA